MPDRFLHHGQVSREDDCLTNLAPKNTTKHPGINQQEELPQQMEQEEPLNLESAQSERLRRVIDGVPGGIGIFEMVGHALCLRYLNNGFHRLLGYNRKNCRRFSGYNFWAAIHPEDLDYVEQAVKSLYEGADSVDLKYRVLNGHGGYTWLRVMGNVRVDEHNKSFVYCSFVNVQETMSAMLELKKNEAMLNLAMQTAKISSWEYDVVEKKILQGTSSQIQHGYGKVIENAPDSMVADGFVHPDSVANYCRLFSSLPPSSPPLTADVQVRTPDRKDYWWERIIITPIYDPHGNHVRSLGTTLDITEQKRMQDKYRQRLHDLENLNSVNLIAKARYNLTRNTCEYYQGTTEDAIARQKTATYDLGAQATADTCLDGDQHATFLAQFNRHHLLQQFNQGNTDISMDYLRRAQSERMLWCQTQAKLFRDPTTGDVICFIYSYDITEQRVLQEMIDTVVRLDYDYIALLDGQNNRYEIYAGRETSRSPLLPSQDNYEAGILEYAQKWVLPKEQSQFLQDASIQNIQKQLALDDRFTSYVNIKDQDGNVRRKMLQCSYLNRRNQKIMVTRVDVTDIYLREQEKVRELQAAKDAEERARIAAERANSVKTKFLSRMSHDLRTPMNAIIGLSALAADEVDNPVAMKEYVSSIGTAGNFLLGLVNDCLDFEKLTAHKVQLNSVPYTYQAFEHNIRIIIEPLCRAKNITLVFGAPQVETTVLIDPIRLEQIFLNLLTNAVKFTPCGGKVELRILNSRIEDGQLSCDLVVQDNGIGMSETFQAHMYEPFVQESVVIEPQSQGTGLGLGIVKNLVELLGGTICVDSTKGVGTTFRVHLSMPVAENSPATQKTGALTGSHFQGLVGKRVLLVEDHPLNTKIAQKLLEKQQMQVFFATNGAESIEQFTHSKSDFFDVILMDIRMPVMDGLEAAKTIRALPRTDAQTVPIVAMSANAFEEDVRASYQAGMNAHLSKPIEPQKLYETLLKVTQVSQSQ